MCKFVFILINIKIQMILQLSLIPHLIPHLIQGQNPFIHYRTLGPDQIKHACRYKPNKDDKEKTPEYRLEFNCGKNYQPSTNICPTEVMHCMLFRTC